MHLVLCPSVIKQGRLLLVHTRHPSFPVDPSPVQVKQRKPLSTFFFFFFCVDCSSAPPSRSVANISSVGDWLAEARFLRPDWDGAFSPAGLSLSANPTWEQSGSM